MPDFSLVPVDHQPDFGDVSLVPVDHDPFSADDIIQQTRAQLESQPQPDAGFDRPPSAPQTPVSAPPLPPMAKDGLTPSISQPPAQDLQSQSQAIRPPGPEGGVSGLIGSKIAEIANDFYNQSILKPARDFRDMGHDLVTDPAYFLHAIGPSLVGLGMSVPTQVGDIGISERAKGIHKVLDGIGQKMRTTAVLETDAGRIIAGGSRDLTPVQRAVLGRGEIAAKATRLHAEVTALNKAANIGATPSALAVTRTICPKCAAAIESLGGKLTSRTTAVFPRR